ncbi:sigma-54-dependent transcriptional regulator [Marinilabilia rubra]|uniref:Regulator n=1 Tax=Marinilabilia rubra TaxID=2162893 RepID=A0A2U2B7Z0_9BACT|nr:sigma-54 dependent transcriptional regulator [Marinilabilia rubra]PWD99177.1 regulator [Marinilabilia rubra]
MRVDIIEDDPVFNKIIERVVKGNNSYETIVHFDGKSFLKQLSPSLNVVTLDLGLPDISGTKLMNQIRKYNPEIEIIIISGQDNIPVAVKLLKEGAYDYITKDENIRERLLHTLRKIEQNHLLKQELAQLKTEVSDKYQFRQTIQGDSPAIKNIFTLIEKAIKVPNINVSLHGETGTGKELTAKTIHYNSPRKNHPFVTLSGSTLMGNKLESSLFGEEKGAFSDSLMTTKGKIEEAGEGTLFIDEVTDFDTDIQLALLNVLQTKKMKRIGGSEEIPVNCRIITATSFDLLQAVREKKFREDLYYLLVGLPISIPPLRERGKDIITLGSSFLSSFCKENNLPPINLSSGAKKKLLSHEYPGNIRELKAIIELAAVLSNSSVLDERHIVFNHSEPTPEILHEELTLKEYNERIILYFLKKYNNVMEVADKLNIGKSTIYNLLKKQKED